MATELIPCHLKIPQVDSDYHINIRISNFVHFGEVSNTGRVLSGEHHHPKLLHVRKLVPRERILRYSEHLAK